MHTSRLPLLAAAAAREGSIVLYVIALPPQALARSTPAHVRGRLLYLPGKALHPSARHRGPGATVQPASASDEPPPASSGFRPATRPRGAAVGCRTDWCGRCAGCRLTVMMTSLERAGRDPFNTPFSRWPHGLLFDTEVCPSLSPPARQSRAGSAIRTIALTDRCPTLLLTRSLWPRWVRSAASAH